MSGLFICDMKDNTIPAPHFWRKIVGSGHATLALRSDWQNQLLYCKKELGFEYVRFHGILTSGMDTLILVKNKKLYSFYNSITIIDYLLSINVRPFIELSFMPKALASGHKTVFHYQANVTPPTRYQNWNKLIHNLVTKWVKRYGIKEMSQWYFEVWNEPNLKNFWNGTQEQYFKLYANTVKTIKKISPSLRVGGPATAKNAWIKDFLHYCERNQLPVDFVSTHHYPTDAFGKISDNTLGQLAASRRSIMREEVQNVVAEAQGKPLIYTEWNSSSNSHDALHDEPYAAAFVVKTLLEAQGLVEGYSYWTFTDIFQENYFSSDPFYGGFGLLTLNSIPKPVFRAFQLLNQLGDKKLWVDGIHPTLNIWIFRKNKNTLTAILTNHALPRHAIQTEKVKIVLHNIKRIRKVELQRIDENNANPKKLWINMGKPKYLNDLQVQKLIKSSEMKSEIIKSTYKNQNHSLEITMQPHSVAALTIHLQ